ncbi:MAG TPA: ABC transporter permease [Puia sp.]|nr:ABC transporter permease [Puia sp.]
MFKNYFKTALRNLWKNKFFSTINIIGLAIGMAACMIILLFVFYEKSFDNFHTKNIYRLNEVQKFEGMGASQKVALSMFPMGPTLKNEFPEIKNYTRVSGRDKFQITFNEKRVYFPQMLFVDSGFLQMFDFKLLEGNRETALEKPNSILLTRSSAKTLFGKEDAIGKKVTHYGSDTITFVVTGVLENTPANSQLQFDGLFSFNTIYKPDWMNNWGGNWLNTYLELAPQASASKLEKKFPNYLKRHMADGEGWKSYELFLLPLKDVHANASDIGLDYINFQKFDKKYTGIFLAIAVIVLVIACINFMNLSTARSAERAREVGIRKTIGAQRYQLGLQFIGETILLSMIALLFATGLVKLSLPFVNNISQRDLNLPLLNSPALFFLSLAGTVIVGILSGLYPAAYLSSFQPVKVLKGSAQTGRNKSLLRNILVVGQFTSAIFLMIATIFVLKQLSYMQHLDPGFNRDQVLTIPLDGVTSRKFDVLKQDLLGNTMVLGVTGAQDQLGSHLDQSGVEYKGEGPMRNLTSTRLIVDPDYLTLYKIALAQGRNFSDNPSANGKEYILNESLASELLKENPGKPQSWLLGKHFGFDSLGTIIGIAKNFNFNSLHYKIETMFMFNQKDWGFSNMSVKINGSRTREAVAFIRSSWSKIFPEHPFEYEFLDEHFQEVYRADEQVSEIIGVLAILAIIISCLGLFGLASHAAEKRIKEVGIRKAMGASVQNIVSLLSRDFVKLVLIANLVAWPIAWFTLAIWLQGFAYRINMNGWIFLWVGMAALLIALVTVSFQAIRAALANPVKSLRTE